MKITLRIVAGILLTLLAAVIGIVIHANIRIAKDEVLSAEADAPGRFYSIDGHKWHVLTVGDVKATSGAPILLIHGFGSPGLAMWQPWSNRLAARRALIMPDNLGYGHSEHITTPGPYYSLKSYAASLAAILDQLGVAQVDVVGHSLGGTIAAQFAVDFPTRVRRLVFIDSAVYFDPEPGITDNMIQWSLGIGRALTWHLTTGGPGSTITRYCKSQSSDQCLRLLKVTNTTESLRAAMYTYRHTPDASQLLLDLPKIRSPSLVIWGSNDPLFPAALGERLARETRADLVLVDRGFHMPYRFQPDLVAKRVLDFLEPR